MSRRMFAQGFAAPAEDMAPPTFDTVNPADLVAPEANTRGNGDTLDLSLVPESTAMALMPPHGSRLTGTWLCRLLGMKARWT